MSRTRLLFAFLAALAAGAAVAWAEPPAKELFGAKAAPAPLAARAIGSYARGCLAGAAMLPVDGPAWQAMRLSRNRNWGHPDLVRLVERLALEARTKDGWPGLLVGDLAQPRGGPMLTGHASHQIGLDADIWLTPMPDRRLSRQEREEMSAVSMIKDPFSINPEVWTERHVGVIRRAASFPEVARIFVHPAIKKALCEAAGSERGWLEKVRPWWGHHYHFHIRIACPAGSHGCEDQPEPPAGDGCGKPLEDWFAMFRRPPPTTPAKPKPPLTLAQLPAECRTVLAAEAIPADASAATAAASLPAQAGLPWLRGASGAVPLPQRKPR